MSDAPPETAIGGGNRRRGNRAWIVLSLLLSLAAAFLAVSQWLYRNEVRRQAAQHRRSVARLLAERVLVDCHWQGLEQAKDSVPVIAELSAALGSSQPYRWKLLHPQGSADPQPAKVAEEFERDVLARFAQSKAPEEGTLEWADRVLAERNEYEYFHPVRARQSCVKVCHRPLPGSAKLMRAKGEATASPLYKEGQLMAVVKIMLPYSSR